MAPESENNLRLEIGHVLFIDLIGYSKLLIEEQKERLRQLTDIVLATSQVAKSTNEQLVRLPTGDGMALVFRNSSEEPARCALEIAEVLRKHPEIPVRMGIHSGPVSEVTDVSGRTNIAGAGINMAQRVMDCGDAGHILVSKRVADDLDNYARWQPRLHDLGEVAVKHGIRVQVVNLFGDGFGNPELPAKFTQARRKRNWQFVGFTILLVLLSAAGLWLRFGPSTRSPPGAILPALPEKSIAVLPFENLSSDKENAYFADGVQDDILTDLAKVADLKVISRRSVAQYRGSTQRVREIGEALQVAYVLEGAVQKVGKKIRVTAQLIETRTEREKWAEKYERDLADVFAIQNEISETIASQLKATLSPAEKAVIETAPTQDMEAFDLYLRARALVHAFGTYAKQTEENRAKAEPLLRAAIARDPKFVLAYCLFAEAQWTPDGGKLTPEQIAQARATLDTALKLAPESGEVHLQLGSFYDAVDDLKRAEEEFKIAARKLPNSVHAVTSLGRFERNHSHWKEALRYARRAIELDPRDPEVAIELAKIYTALRRYDESDQLLDRTFVTLPQVSTSWLWLQKGENAVARGDTNAAMAAYDSNPMRNAGLAYSNGRIAHVLALERRYEEAAASLSTIEKIARAHDTLDKGGISEWELAKANLELGIVRRAQGKPEMARAAFEAAKTKFAAWLAKDTTLVTALAYTAMCDAGLGNKEAALRQARQAQELCPKSRDLQAFTQVTRVAAVVYAWSGEHAAALDQLEAIVALPDSVNLGDLMLNPQWDELRREPRFQRVVAEAARPVKID